MNIYNLYSTKISLNDLAILNIIMLTQSSLSIFTIINIVAKNIYGH